MLAQGSAKTGGGQCKDWWGSVQRLVGVPLGSAADALLLPRSASDAQTVFRSVSLASRSYLQYKNVRPDCEPAALPQALALPAPLCPCPALCSALHPPFHAPTAIAAVTNALALDVPAKPIGGTS